MVLLTIFVVTTVLVAFFFLRRGKEAGIKLTEIRAVFEKVKAAGKDETFAQFCFGVPDETVKDRAVNVQFSVESGRVGFDWMLTTEVNRRDRDRFLAMADRLGHHVTEHKAANGCEYLRVEDGDLVALCRASISELYGLSETATLTLVWEGFDWP